MNIFFTNIFKGLYRYFVIPFFLFFYKKRRNKKSKPVLVFTSFPDYSDNSRALSDYIINDQNLRTKYKIVWIVKEDFESIKSLNLNNIEFVKLNNFLGEQTIKTIKYVALADFIFTTHKFPFAKKKIKGKQKFIQLWHGCSFKKNENKKRIDGTSLFDLALVAGDFFVKTKMDFWNIPENYLLSKGYPRYDWFNSQIKGINMLKKSICFGAERFVVWMPTFRNDKYGNFNQSDSITEFPIVHTKNDWEHIDTFCVKSNICIIIKFHEFQDQYQIDFSRFKNIKVLSSSFFNAHNIQLYSFLGHCDGLITDYSSIGIDFLIADKPIAYTTDDFIAYKKTRGFIIDNPLDFMPGYHLNSINDLMEFLNDIYVKNDSFKDTRNKIKTILLAESNNYCQDIVNALGL